MDSLAAAPGTGPATSPLPVIRPARTPKTVGDLPVDRAVVMGILNVTPDSFSDGGTYASTDDAIGHGLRMHYGGADVIDVGGESTRPNASGVPVEEELARVLPVVRALVKAGALVSIDTMHAETARQALDAGAAIVNDISGTEFDPDMPALIAERGVPYILTHRRGTAATMDSLADYDDVVTDVVSELTALRDGFVAAGVAAEQIILDPGLGFAKTDEHNWTILQNLAAFTGLGHRILVGASRKRFLGTLLTSAGKAAAPVERDHASLAVATLSAASGAWGVRVHDPATTLDAVKVAAAVGPRS
ncbi:dihydropteroate synthase [Arthrobacter agilis]|uniref:dihydropteroate synthase n=1 Tax=Arthrobacter agilis TaxID=37921 RepID=UPI000B35F4E2|nr:dihydropteroate synthase [Arthrobacter agilis]OUM42382.1 dihydropteroate synthase [Arthrobacter agilis]PPB45723.1 dihydropteroate synthase [Arthrobacter agilis]TPV26296.1 dihydropteroate synthase [Arthrobacter agilis]VDR30851.1 Dihydropteroate synthase 1 [Arthrobacter agilis]